MAAKTVAASVQCGDKKNEKGDGASDTACNEGGALAVRRYLRIMRRNCQPGGIEEGGKPQLVESGGRAFYRSVTIWSGCIQSCQQPRVDNIEYPRREGK